MTTPATGSVVPAGESPIRVLIAEDEAHLGAILQQFMTARGFRVRMVRDGRSALELLRRELFYVALRAVTVTDAALSGAELTAQAPVRGFCVFCVVCFSVSFSFLWFAVCFFERERGGVGLCVCQTGK